MVELDAESEMSRTDAAAFFRRFADELEGRGAGPDIGDEGTTDAERMTLIVGDESATVVLPERLDLDVEVGSRSGLLESGDAQRVVFELTWEVEEHPEDDSIEVT